VVDVECAVGSTPCLAAADPRGYEIDEAEVAYWGRCPDCVDRSRAPSRSSPSIRRLRSQRKAAGIRRRKFHRRTVK
jgi:Fur family ferric uptake transcriptional regulator